MMGWNVALLLYVFGALMLYGLGMQDEKSKELPNGAVAFVSAIWPVAALIVILKIIRGEEF